MSAAGPPQGANAIEPGVDVRELVQEADLGRRKPVGIAATILAATCIGWSLLQLWYASPLPFTFNVFILNDTEMRSLHLGIALFLAFLAYPFRKSSPRDRVPAQELIGRFLPLLREGAEAVRSQLL